MGLLTEYPIWLLPFCLLAGALFSAGLYYRWRRSGDRSLIPGVLMLLRFFSVSLVAFLLLTPLLRRTARQLEKPVIAIGIDESMSVVSSADSSMVRDRLNTSLEDLSRKLSDRFDVAFYSFGQDVSPGMQQYFKGKHTDISEFFTEVGNKYVNRNLGAIIIATDGIYNKGADPAYASMNLNVPVYSIALGDTSLKSDVLIRNISVSRQVWLNDEFPFEVIAELDKYAGKESRLVVRHKGAIVFNNPITAAGERAFIRVSGTLKAKEKGMQKYSVEIETPGNEFNKINNKRDFYVEVLESRIKVALVYESPHPDISAIVSALGSSARFEVSQLAPSELQAKAKDFNLFILYQLPSVRGISDISGMLPEGSPLLIFLGSQTDFAGLNRMKSGLVVNSRKKTVTDIQPLLNPDFSLFGIDREFTGLTADFPPLQCPSGSFEASALADVLFYQKIGNVETKYPLIMFFDLPSRKSCIIAGENIWRWRMYDYIQKSDFRLFDDMITRIAQYLSVKDDPSPLRINVKNRFEEGDPLEFDASLFNPGHELINGPDVKLELKNEEGKTYPFIFTRTEKAYYLNAGSFPPGDYSYQASVKTPQAEYKKNGFISITPLDIELVNLTADWPLLENISSKHEGKVIRQKDIPVLADLIKKRNDLKSIIHLQKRYTDLTSEWWMLLLIVLLLSSEWAIRKRNGM